VAGGSRFSVRAWKLLLHGRVSRGCLVDGGRVVRRPGMPEPASRPPFVDRNHGAGASPGHGRRPVEWEAVREAPGRGPPTAGACRGRRTGPPPSAARNENSAILWSHPTDSGPRLQSGGRDARLSRCCAHLRYVCIVHIFFHGSPIFSRQPKIGDIRFAHAWATGETLLHNSGLCPRAIAERRPAAHKFSMVWRPRGPARLSLSDKHPPNGGHYASQNLSCK